MAEGSGPSGLQDDELYLPRTVVNKLIKEIVPNIRVTNDARDLLLNCCTEFIHLIASEASDISEQQQKKVISPEHVVEALNTLGFQEYVADVEAVHKEYKEQASKHRKRGKSKLDRLGIPEEELLRQQQQLFEEARQQQMESELLEHQRAQQQSLILQQQQQQQVQQTPQQQQVSLQQPAQSQLQGLTQSPTALAQLASSTQHQHHPLQVPSQATTAAPSPSPLATTSLGAAHPPATVVGSIPHGGGGGSGVSQSIPGAIRTTSVDGQQQQQQHQQSSLPSSLGGLSESQILAGMAALQQQQQQQNQAQGINTAGLSMLAAVGARQQQEQQQQQLQQVQQQKDTTTTPQPAPAKLQGPPSILPQNAAITVASLQATSSLLQQALAMASAQVAANSTAQQRPPATSCVPTSVLGGATGGALPLPQSLLLQQHALAALAAQQVQMGSQLSQQLGGQAVATPSTIGGKGPFAIPSSSTSSPSTNAAAVSGPAATVATTVPGLLGTGANLQGHPIATSSNQGPIPGSGMESGQLDSKVFPPT